MSAGFGRKGGTVDGDKPNTVLLATFKDSFNSL